MKTAQDKSRVSHFLNKGFIRIENSINPEYLRLCREWIWERTGIVPGAFSTYPGPVLRLDCPEELSGQDLFKPEMNRIFDMLTGKGQWQARKDPGTFVIRMRHKEDPLDTGWHVDASFPGEDPSDYLKWRINEKTDGRALLLLILFTDVGRDDAPTLIREGSHRTVAQLLRPFGRNGMSFMDLSEKLSVTEDCRVVYATGAAGTVYCCHPFLVHAAQKMKGNAPRIICQPPVQWSHETDERRDQSPVMAVIGM